MSTFGSVTIPTAVTVSEIAINRGEAGGGAYFYIERRYSLEAEANAQSIHIWLTQDDVANAPLMILLAYIIVGHPEWRKAEIRILAHISAVAVEQETGKLGRMIEEGRLPISRQKVTAVPHEAEPSLENAVATHSVDSDLVILGLSLEQILHNATEALSAHSCLNDVLFVYASEDIPIS